MKKKKLMMSGLMALVLGLGISGSALAYQGDFSKKGPNYTPEFEAKITDAMTTKNYQEWKDAMEEKVGNGRVTEVINESNFAKFAEAWQLAHEGKIKEANAIRKELNLRTNDGTTRAIGRGNGNGAGNGMGIHRTK